MAIAITYRRTRRLSMRIVKNGDVHVSVPIGVPKREVEKFIEEHRDWIADARKKTLERQKQRAEFYNRLPLTTRAQADEALQRLKALVEPLVERHSKIMGVSPRFVWYKPMISRWGVCNYMKRRITYAVMLADKPRECVEYVVVHELTHLKAHGHGPKFKALMDARLPDWRERRRKLEARGCQ